MEREIFEQNGNALTSHGEDDLSWCPEPPPDAWPDLPVEKFTVGIDDSGSSQGCVVHNANDPMLVLAGAYVSTEKLNCLTAELEEIRRKAFSGMTRKNRGDELHTQVIVHGSQGWSRVKEKTRREYLEQVVAIAEKHSVEFVLVGLHKLGFQARANHERPITFALDQMLATVAQIAERQSSWLPQTPFKVQVDRLPEIVESSSQAYVKQMVDLDIPLIGHDDLTLRYIDREIDFVDSRSSSLVQLADLAAFVVRRQMCSTLKLFEGGKIDKILGNVGHQIDGLITSSEIIFPFDNVVLSHDQVSPDLLPRTRAADTLVGAFARNRISAASLSTRSERRKFSRQVIESFSATMYKAEN